MPKDLAESMWAYARGSTCVHYHEKHYCNVHECEVDRKHLAECPNINDVGNLKDLNKRIHAQNLRDWDRPSLVIGILRYSLFKSRLQALEESGIFTRMIRAQK